MKKAFLLILVFLSAICAAQEKPVRNSMTEMIAYLEEHPQGVLAVAYSDSLAIRWADTFGPTSQEEDYTKALSFARTEKARQYVLDRWSLEKGVQEDVLEKQRKMLTWYLEAHMGAVVSYSNAFVEGVSVVVGIPSISFLPLAGLSLEVGPIWGPLSHSTKLGITLEVGAIFRIPTIRSYISSCIVFPIPTGKNSILDFSPQLSLEYGFGLSSFASITVFSRICPWPLYKQKQIYESTDFDYNMIRPILNERIRLGVKFCVFPKIK